MFTLAPSLPATNVAFVWGQLPDVFAKSKSRIIV